MARIFLCHASEDKAQVREVYQRLAAVGGFEPWLDEEELLPGQLWEEEIPRALRASDFILIFFSSNSVAKRGYVQRDMKMALDVWQEIPGMMIHTIPVRLDECEVPEPFRRYHYANLFDPGGFDRLVTTLQRGLEPRGLPIPAGPTLPPAFTNSIGMEFILIPAGTFTMGSPDSDQNAYDDEKPSHQVTITQPYYMGTYEVTQAQWQAVMGNNPSRIKADHRPIDHVAWAEVQQLIQKLNQREGVTHYRLPTEAEWEYACRAGTTTRYSFGNDFSLVELFKPNPWGLYHMHGFVWEWVEDGKRAYVSEAVSDPKGPTDADVWRVIRGGRWPGLPVFSKSAARLSYPCFTCSHDIGFRCAMSISSK